MVNDILARTRSFRCLIVTDGGGPDAQMRSRLAQITAGLKVKMAVVEAVVHLGFPASEFQPPLAFSHQVNGSVTPVNALIRAL